MPKNNNVLENSHMDTVPELLVPAGDFDCVRARIRLARNIYSCEEYVKVTEEQMCNTCWHEIFHVFNYHMNNETDETIAQSFANFMREFESSAGI